MKYRIELTMPLGCSKQVITTEAVAGSYTSEDRLNGSPYPSFEVL